MTGRVLPALLLAIITLFGGAATASAGAPPLGGPAYSASQYYASVSRGTCSRDSQTAYAYMQESGWSGTEWMRIDAYFQYRYRGDWYTTKHIHHYSRYYFSDDGASHELDWNKRFDYRGNDYDYDTRIHFSFRWLTRDGDTLFRRIQNSRTRFA